MINLLEKKDTDFTIKVKLYEQAVNIILNLSSQEFKKNLFEKININIHSEIEQFKTYRNIINRYLQLTNLDKFEFTEVVYYNIISIYEDNNNYKIMLQQLNTDIIYITDLNVDFLTLDEAVLKQETKDIIGIFTTLTIDIKNNIYTNIPNYNKVVNL